MQTYGGIDPKAPLSTPSGKGKWPLPDCITTDTLSAGNLMAAVQATIDRVNYLAWRVHDHQHSGAADYTPQGVVRFLANTGKGWAFECYLSIRSATEAFVESNGVLRIGRPGVSKGRVIVDATGGASGSEIEAKSGGQVRATAGGIVLADGVGAALVAINGADMANDSASTYTQSGPHVKAGAAAVTVPRLDTTAATSTVADATTADVIIVSGNPGVILTGGGGVGTGQLVTLTPPPNGTAPGICVRLVMGAGRSTSGLYGDVAYLAAQSGSGSTFYAYSQIGHGGNTIAPLFLDMMVEVVSGATRKWVAIASSGAGMPLP